MDLTRLEMRFRRGDATADAMQAVADDVLTELADPASEAVAEARAAGIDLTSVDDIAIEFRESAHGAEPFVTSVIVGITVSVGSKIANSLWENVLWPRIKRRLGARALGSRQSTGR